MNQITSKSLFLSFFLFTSVSLINAMDTDLDFPPIDFTSQVEFPPMDFTEVSEFPPAD